MENVNSTGKHLLRIKKPNWNPIFASILIKTYFEWPRSNCLSKFLPFSTFICEKHYSWKSLPGLLWNYSHETISSVTDPDSDSMLWRHHFLIYPMQHSLSSCLMKSAETLVFQRKKKTEYHPSQFIISIEPKKRLR